MRRKERTKPFRLSAILMVIAVGIAFGGVTIPAYLESGTRARMAVVNSRLETYAMALEAYRLDHLDYPPWYMMWGGDYTILPFSHLTTPLCYLPIEDEKYDALGYWPENTFIPEISGYQSLNTRARIPPSWYRIRGYGAFCWGPGNCVSERGSFDRRAEDMRDAGISVPDGSYYALFNTGAIGVRLTNYETMHQYDPSNGTFSQGVMWRFGP